MVQECDFQKILIKVKTSWKYDHKQKPPIHQEWLFWKKPFGNNWVLSYLSEDPQISLMCFDQHNLFLDWSLPVRINHPGTVRKLFSDLLSGVDKSQRVQDDLSDHGVIWNHHGHCSEENLQVPMQMYVRKSTGETNVIPTEPKLSLFSEFFFWQFCDFQMLVKQFFSPLFILLFIYLLLCVCVCVCVFGFFFNFAKMPTDTMPQGTLVVFMNLPSSCPATPDVQRSLDSLWWTWCRWDSRPTPFPRT